MKSTCCVLLLLLTAAATAKQSINKCDSYPGADASVKIVACIKDLPPSGGVADATAFSGKQDITVNICDGMTNQKRVTVLLGEANFYLTTPIACSNSYGVRIAGTYGGIPGALGQGTVLYWNGPDSGAVLDLDGIYGGQFENFSIVPAAGKTIGIGVRIDQTKGLSSNNQFRNLFIGTASGSNRVLTGVQIGDQAQANNELHSFDNVVIQCTAAGSKTGTYGYHIFGSQSKFNTMTKGTVGFCEYGIKQEHGSFQTINLNYSNNRIDNYIWQADDVISIMGCQSEGAERFLERVESNSGDAWAVSIRSCRIAQNGLAADKIALKFSGNGPLILEGNDFSDGIFNPDYRFRILNCCEWVTVQATGNIFPNRNVFTLDNNGSGLFLTAQSNVYWPAPNEGMKHFPTIIANKLLDSGN